MDHPVLSLAKRQELKLRFKDHDDAIEARRQVTDIEERMGINLRPSVRGRSLSFRAPCDLSDEVIQELQWNNLEVLRVLRRAA